MLLIFPNGRSLRARSGPCSERAGNAFEVSAVCRARAGLGKDGTTFPVRVSLTPVTTGQLTLAVIRDITGTGRLGDLAVLARDAAAARREHLRLLDAVITGLFHAGLGLQAAGGLPVDAARQRTEAVLGELDDIIRQIRSAAFTDREQPGPCPPRAPGDAW